jgi:hypothetical protein
MTRGGARGYTDYSHQAGKVAVFNAAQPLIQNIYNAVMKSWSTQISFGGEISIEIDGFASASQAFGLKRNFKEIPGVGSVNGPSYTDGLGVYRVLATMTAEDMMEYLSRRDWGSRIEVVDVTQNRIQAKWIGQ